MKRVFLMCILFFSLITLTYILGDGELHCANLSTFLINTTILPRSKGVTSFAVDWHKLKSKVLRNMLNDLLCSVSLNM